MMNLDRKWMNLALCAAVGFTVSLVGTGCSNEPEQPVAVAPPPPPPAPVEPPKPSVTPIEQLMVDLNIDPKVVLPEEKAPDNDVDRTAVLVFFDAIARGNAEALKAMLPLTDQLELAALIEAGEWQKTVSRIQTMEIQTGTYEDNKCALAVIEVGTGANMTFQPQLWYYHTEEEQAQFEAAPTPPNIMDKLSGNDWIAAWHKILDEEATLAMRMDEIEEFTQRNLEESKDSSTPETGDTGKGQFREPTAPIAPPDPGGGPGGR